ncbi:MAG: sugar ABC transporter substrate-binding protein [Armatimonadota bacterium]|nr:sugar ABC transporter substrate-binding protein [Armatimonadota bacterium]
MKRNRKLFFLLLTCILAASVILAGCGKTNKSSTAKKPKIALVMKSLANEFFKTMEDGAKAHQKSHESEYELIANGIKDEQDVAKQIDLVEQMIAQNVDAIVIAPADSKSLVPVCKRAIDAGIVVVNIDNKFDAGALADKKVKIPFIGPDNRKGAELAGKTLAEKLKAGDKVAIVEGVPNAFNATQRKLGFEDAVKSAKLNVVTSQTGNWEMDKANQVVSGMVTEHPDIKAILCANDNMALGAVAALKAAGKSDKVFVVGFDNISAVRQLVKDGKILATVDQHADKLAVFGIEYALEMVKAKSKPADRETPVDLITRLSLK